MKQWLKPEDLQHLKHGDKLIFMPGNPNVSNLSFIGTWFPKNGEIVTFNAVYPGASRIFIHEHIRTDVDHSYFYAWFQRYIDPLPLNFKGQQETITYNKV